jgi:Protein of unknown function (DUF2721)
MDSASGLIQIMLAPGLMISACGLLLLGMNNKYSLVVNRIRLLNEERRRFRHEKQQEKNLERYHKSIDLQIEKLSQRISLIRNAVFSYSIAVAFFILSSLMIGINQYSHTGSINWLVILTFLVGMLFVFSGIVYAAFEVWRGYQIVCIEIEDES